MNRELPDVQAGFRKGRGTRDQMGNIRWLMEKATEFQKNIYFCFIDYAKAFDCVDHKKLWTVSKLTYTIFSLYIHTSDKVYKLVTVGDEQLPHNCTHLTR